MQKIPGRQIADQILDDLKSEIQSKDLRPKLGVLLVGDDPASALYVALKQKAAERIGILTDVRRLPAETSDDELKSIISSWNEDKDVHGILIQLPLPEGHDTDALVAVIDPQKDADGFHPINVQALQDGEAKIVPPLHEGILRLIASTGVTPNHSLAIIVANSHIFADPLKHILEKAGATVQIEIPSATTGKFNFEDKELRQADTIVVAVGKAGFLTSNSVKDGTVLIDVGTNKTPDGKVRGDFDPTGSEELQGWYTPVPGGVGPMTVAMLMKTVKDLAE
ncbi:MAG: bifunctional 5,10-methylenetetrahydrofolate dehydrogenase/5,10-methenyltetrahydrofolate cyclohydrolase [Patescibacteria group bacterium]|nr:bifunctional 5,10-methylenetetrahydrofolate dehydrogenase/5,10-methenyltetrahydrofolate cyclohydrolase [Patescibacteria group bacterium]